MVRFTFVDWGDGYFVYKDGEYLGKDDQVDLEEEMVLLGVAEWRHLTDEEDIFGPQRLEDLDTEKGRLP